MKQKVAFHASSVYNISMEFFKGLKIKAVVCDLDNTLDPADTLIPRDEAFNLKEKLKEIDIQLIVLSNNVEKRVGPYCQKLDVPYLSSSNKFTAKKIRHFLVEQLKLNIDECIFIGDQLFTDRIYVNKLKGRLILTEPISKKDHFFTSLYRWLDKIVRKRWKKKGLLGQECS